MNQRSGVKIGVLGPVEVIVDDAVVSLSPQLKRLLGLLVVADGQVVSADRLATYLADGRVEGSTVRTAVSRLRKVVGDRVQAADGGYRLVVGDELDLRRFDGLRERARSEPGDERVASLREAFGLWRGAAFGDLADEEWAVLAANSAEQAKVACVEQLGDALVDAGLYSEAVELLEPFVAEQPFREQAVGLLMRALHGDGRTTDGLRTYERFRVNLREEVGLDPSPELNAIEAELLTPAVGGRVSGGLPDGTVTFLFTGIVGSTERWQADEAGMAAELVAHDAVLREAVASHGGVVFKHVGNGVAAVFSSAQAAVTAAVVAQQDLRLPVRMGLHTGEAELRDDDYFGPTVNRASRIADAGHGGQVLLSASTASLVTDDDLSELGEHRLEGLESPEQVWQVGLDAEFPPLRAETAHRGNLPLDPSPFIGRRDEIDELVSAVIDHRVVSLIGVGGSGKTRLAVETARSLAPAFPDGCWFVELADIGSDDLVPSVIAQALGIGDAGADPCDVVTKLLARQRALLVVDNCEHVLGGSGEAIEQIVTGCPTVTVLATSREPLMVAGERLVPTPSLNPTDAEALFLDRARAEASDLDLDETQRAAVAEICRRLDGLPLAIELAAARLRAMTPVEIERRLDERFRLLVGGRRAGADRHRTMAAALDWSLDLCSPVEQTVFARLSVFASEFDLAAAVAVCRDDDGGLDDIDVEDAVPQLVDRSLVRRVVGPDGFSRFRLLETMRAYGHHRLLDIGDADHRRKRHAEHIDRTLCALSFEAWGPEEDHARSRVRAMVPETLAAASWCLEAQDWARAYRLGSVCALSAWATASEIMGRLHDAVDADTAVDAAKTLGRLRTAVIDDVVLISRQDSAGLFRPAPDPVGHTGVGELLGAEHHLIEDHLGYAAIFALARGRLEFDDVGRFLDRFGGELAHRCYLEWAAIETQVHTKDSERALDRVPVVEEMVDRLDSRLLRRRLDGSVALALEQVGDIDGAADRMAAFADDAPETPHHTDVVHAVRRNRINVRAGRPVSGSDIRRPWDLVDANPGLESAFTTVVANTAAVLDLLGESTLAGRLMLQTPSDLRVFLRPLFESIFTGELKAVLHSDEVATEPLDAVKADVFRFADTL